MIKKLISLTLVLSVLNSSQAAPVSHPDVLGLSTGMSFNEISNFVRDNGLVYEAVWNTGVVVRDNQTGYIPNINIMIFFCEPNIFEAKVERIVTIERFINDEEASYNSYDMIEKHRSMLDLIYSQGGKVVGSRPENENGTKNGMLGNAITYQMTDSIEWELGIFRRIEVNNLILQLTRSDNSVCSTQ